MNRRVCVWAGSIVGAAVCGWALGGGTALAQAIPPVAAPPPIPTGSVPTPVRTAWANPNLAQARAAIGPFMAAQLGTIGSAGATATNQTAARLSLILACTRGNTTAAYYQAYATEWAQQAGPILKNPATPVRVKIDVGVVTASVAATTNGSTLLTPIIDQLLSDPNPAVADWGMKAARPVIITLLAQSGGPGTSTLIGDVVKSATDHARDLSGVVAEDAYQALVITAPAAAFGAAAPPPLTPLFDPVLKLLAVRTKRYAAGLVPAPDAEDQVPLFLSQNYAAMPAAQKAVCVQELVDFVSSAGQRANLAVDPKVEHALLRTIKNAASALNVMAGPGQPVANIANLGISATPAQIMAATSAVFQQMGIPFPKLKPPPTLTPMQPPPPPPPPKVPGKP